MVIFFKILVTLVLLGMIYIGVVYATPGFLLLISLIGIGMFTYWCILALKDIWFPQ